MNQKLAFQLLSSSFKVLLLFWFREPERRSTCTYFMSLDSLCAEQLCPLNFRLCTVDGIKYGEKGRHAKCQMINVCPTVDNLCDLRSSMI